MQTKDQSSYFHQNFSHLPRRYERNQDSVQQTNLVSSLSAPNIDDNIRIGVLGQRLRNDSLAASEGTGNGRGTSLDTSSYNKSM